MDFYYLKEKRSVTPEKLIKTLQENGTEISLEKAKKILELIYRLSNLSVKETITKLPDRELGFPRKKITRHSRKNKKT